MDQFKKLLKLAIEKQATRIQLRSDMYPHLFTQQSEKFSCSVFSEVKHEWIKEILQQIFSDPSLIKQALSGSDTEGTFSIRGVGEVYTVSYGNANFFELNLFLGTNALESSKAFWSYLRGANSDKNLESHVSEPSPAHVSKPQIPPLPSVYAQQLNQETHSQKSQNSQQNTDSSLDHFPTSEQESKPERARQNNDDMGYSLSSSFNAAASQQFSKMNSEYESGKVEEVSDVQDRRTSERSGEDDVSLSAIAYKGEDVSQDSNALVDDDVASEQAVSFSELPSTHPVSAAAQQISWSEVESEKEPSAVSENAAGGRESSENAWAEKSWSQEISLNHFEGSAASSKSRESAVEHFQGTSHPQEHQPAASHQQAQQQQDDWFSKASSKAAVDEGHVNEGGDYSSEMEFSATPESSDLLEMEEQSIYPSKFDATALSKGKELAFEEEKNELSDLSKFDSYKDDSESSLLKEKESPDASGKDLEFFADKDKFYEDSSKDHASPRGSLSSELVKELTSSHYESATVPGEPELTEKSEQVDLDASFSSKPARKNLGDLEEMLEQFVKNEIKIAYFSSQKRMFYKKDASFSHFSGASFETEELLELFASGAPETFQDTIISQGSSEYIVRHGGVSRFYVHISSLNDEMHVLMKDLMAFSWNGLASGLSKRALSSLSWLAKDLVGEKKSGGIYLLSSFGSELSETLGYTLCEQALNTRSYRLMVLSGAAFYPLKTLRGGSVYQKHIASKSAWFETLDLAKEDQGLDILFLSRLSPRHLGVFLAAYLIPLSRRGVKVIINLSAPSSYYAFRQLATDPYLTDKPYIFSFLAAELRYVLAACDVRLDSGAKNTLIEAASLSTELSRMISKTSQGWDDLTYYQKWLDHKHLTLDEQIFGLAVEGRLSPQKATLLALHEAFYNSLVRKKQFEKKHSEAERMSTAEDFAPVSSAS